MSISPKSNELQKLRKIKSNDLLLYESLPIFLGESIILTAKHYKSNTQNLRFFGYLIISILESKKLIINPYSKHLQKNFNPDSDIVTVVLTLLEFFLITECDKESKSVEYGFNYKYTRPIFEKLIQVARNYQIKVSDIIDCLRTTVNSIDVYEFIETLFKFISSQDEEWLKSQEASYITIRNTASEPQVLYAVTSNEAKIKEGIEEIIIKKRPGAPGYLSPGHCYIFSRLKINGSKSAYGAFVHRIGVSERCNEPMVCLANCSLMFQNRFSELLFHAYLKNESGLQKFSKHRFEETDSDGDPFILSHYMDKCAITYCPKSEESNEMFQNLVKNMEKIMPFTPSTILVKNINLECVIAVRTTQMLQQNPLIYFFNENKSFPYEINKESLDFVFQHIDELPSVKNNLLIAITGEDLTSNIYFDVEFESRNGKLKRPIVSTPYDCVFNSNVEYTSLMVIISENEIPNGKRLKWTEEKNSSEEKECEYIVKRANTVVPDVIHVEKYGSSIFCFNPISKITHVGTIPNINDDLMTDFAEQTKECPISALFDLVAMNYINNVSLISNIDLSSFGFDGPDISSAVIQRAFIDQISEYKKWLEEKESYYHVLSVWNKQDELEREIKANKSELMTTLVRLKRIKKKESDSDLGTVLTKIMNLEKAIEELKKKRTWEAPNEYPELPLHLAMKWSKEFTKIKTPDECDKIISSLPSEKLFPPNIRMFECGPSGFYYILPESEIKSFERVVSTVFEQTESITGVSVSTENIPVYKVVVSNPRYTTIEKEQFVASVNDTCAKFGALIQNIGEYIEMKDSKEYKGQIEVILFSLQFILPFVYEISHMFSHVNDLVLRINPSVFDEQLLEREDIAEQFLEWLNTNNIHLQKFGSNFYGPQNEIDKCLMHFEKEKPDIGFKQMVIPAFINIDSLSVAVKNFTKDPNMKMYINTAERIISFPSNVSPLLVRRLVFKYSMDENADPNKEIDENEYLGDYLLCCASDAILSRSVINIYKSDGTVECRNFCKTCLESMISAALDRLYDSEKNIINIERIYENIDALNTIELVPELDESDENWPIIPLGQFMWALISEADLSTPAKCYISVVAHRLLKSSPFITFCPDHSYILYKAPHENERVSCICAGCDCILCEKCHQWHKVGFCKKVINVPPGYRICPNCHKIVEKTAACNHIKCSCGKHFCFYCGAGPFDDSGPCYDHMTKEHGGYGVNPPDYIRYYLKQVVSDEDFAKFYKKYPHLEYLSIDI